MNNDHDMIRRGDARIAAIKLAYDGDHSVANAIAALPAVTPKVKSLVWVDMIGRMKCEADTIIGRYCIAQDGAWIALWLNGKRISGTMASINAAKAAAQADYEARILAALEPQPIDAVTLAPTTVDDSQTVDLAAYNRGYEDAMYQAGLTPRQPATQPVTLAHRYKPSMDPNDQGECVICGGGPHTEVKPTPQPVTLADALAVPEVKALVEAANGLLFAHDHGNGLEGWHNTRERLRAAIAAMRAEVKP